jgi:hypothetical protein
VHRSSAGQLKGLISSRESINGHSEQCPTSHTDDFQGRAHKKKKKTSEIDGTVGGETSFLHVDIIIMMMMMCC